MIFHAVIGLLAGAILCFLVLAAGHGRVQDYNRSLAAKLSGKKAVFSPNYVPLGLMMVIMVSSAIIIGRLIQ